MVSLSENLQQDHVMAFYQSLAYEASAGSGKTFALVIRYISLLYLGAKPHTILALTFTNKAASEMAERISTVLGELHLPKRDAERAEIARTVQISEEEILARREAIHRTYLQSELRISTIDKFFGQIVRLFSQHLGIMPDFSIDTNRDMHRFLLRFLSNVKKEEAYRDLVRFAARENRRIGNIFTFLSDLYAKDAELAPLKERYDPHTQPERAKIFALIQKLGMLFEDSCDTLSASGKKALDTADIDNPELLPDKKTWLCKESLSEYSYFKKCYTPEMDTLFFRIKAVLNDYMHARDSYLLGRYFHLYGIYKQTLLEENIATNLLSFDDVTNLLYRLLHEKIDSDFLYFRLDTRIEHMLIDEFQDTNIVQYKILAPIIEEIHAGVGTSGGLKSFFYVGDIKQSIYRFRGGAKELFHFVAQKYGVTLKHLDTNYRSDCEVVSFVNETFGSVIPGYHPQKCRDAGSGGYVKVATHGEVPEGVTGELFALLEKGVSPDDIAILTFTNDNAFAIEEALLKEDPGLRITTQSSAKLISQPPVSAVIETLKYLYFKEALCKASFLTQSGYSWLREIDLGMLKITTPLPKLVREIIRLLDLPGDDANLLKLIEVVSEYEDIEAFLFASEELTVEAPSKESAGIRILTIHKSKGLEFDHVILADRMTRQRPDTSTLLYDYDEITLENLYVRTKKRECVDPAYADAKQKAERLTLEDQINLMYVAFTRAKQTLIICQKEKDSAFAPLALQEIERGNIKPSEKRSVSREEVPFSYRPVALGLQEKPPKNRAEESDDLHAINYGNALHYMLEVLDGFSPEDLENAWWAMKNRYEMLLQEGESLSIKKRVERLLQHATFRQLTEGTLCKEQPLVYNNELRQIDLLVEKEGHYVVIDYKSSPVVRSEHKNQVRHYKKAIAEITGVPASAWLCYLREDTIELVEVA